MALLHLDAYFDRIGYAGSRAPSLSTLNAVILAHTSSIPFENLDVLLERPIELDLPSIVSKLIDARRGGYCFEQNSLFLAVLTELGFLAKPLSARVRIGRARESIPPRTHMFLRVELDEQTWLVDVGVGGLSPTCALRLELGVDQLTPHETRRIIGEGDWQGMTLRSPGARLLHQARLGEEWQDVCEFTLEEMPEIDRIVANWFTSTHPNSHFRDRLMVARTIPGGRLTLLNRELTRRSVTGQCEVRLLESSAELRAVLVHEFGLRLADGIHIPCPGIV